MMPALAGAGKQQGRDRRGTFLLAEGRQDPRLICYISLLLLLHSFSPFALWKHPPAKRYQYFLSATGDHALDFLGEKGDAVGPPAHEGKGLSFSSKRD